VAATASSITFLFSVYVTQHCLRLIYGSTEQDVVQLATHQLCLFCLLAVVVIYCFVRAATTPPGSVPDEDEWDRGSEATATPIERQSSSAGRGSLIELKKSGERRHCKWCLKFKPDRCHHCRICGTCVLRMDHHCPWIHNCVGFRNYKLFFLLVTYAELSLLLICVTMFETVWWSTRVDVSVLTMCTLIFAETFAMFLAVLVGVFWMFHIWLVSKAMTTLEFCEKRLKDASYDSSRYSSGVYANFCAALGPWPALWLFPVALCHGDEIEPPAGSPAADAAAQSVSSENYSSR
jgi:hypothetical protein